jgi:WD40 repeat protein
MAPPFLAAAIGSLLTAASVTAAESSMPPASFSKEIAPLLTAKCVTCHGPDKAKGHYRLDSFAAIMQAGESNDAPIVAGSVEKSHLFQLITAKDPDDRMPQKDDPLPAVQVALIERWIREGAKFDGADPNQPLASLLAANPQPDPPAAYARPVPVLALAFSPECRELLTGGYHEVIIWDAIDGNLRRRLKNVAQQVHALAFSPDGSLLCEAGGAPGRLGEVKLFNPNTGTLLKMLATTRDAMLTVAFSPDGKHLAAAGADNAIRLFAMPSGQQEFLIEQHADWVMGLAFSPDGSTLASASRDKTTRLFDTRTGELEQTYTGHSGPVFSVGFSADGKRVVSASRDREIHLWEPKDAKKLGAIDGFEGDVLKLCVHSNQIFSVCTDRRVRQHSMIEKTPELVRSFVGHEDFIYGLALHEKTGRLATSSYDGEVRVWEIESGKLLLKFIAAPGFVDRSADSPVREPQGSRR